MQDLDLPIKSVQSDDALIKSRNVLVLCNRCYVVLDIYILQFYIEDIPLCLMSYKINRRFIGAVKRLVFPILMVICFGPFEFHPAVLQKLNLRYMQCSHAIWGPIIRTVVLKYTNI